MSSWDKPCQNHHLPTAADPCGQRGGTPPHPGMHRATWDLAPRPSHKPQGRSIPLPGSPPATAVGKHRLWLSRSTPGMAQLQPLTDTQTSKTSFLLTTGHCCQQDKVQPAKDPRQGAASQGSHVHGNIILRYSSGSWSEQEGLQEPWLSTLPARSRRMFRAG